MLHGQPVIGLKHFALRKVVKEPHNLDWPSTSGVFNIFELDLCQALPRHFPKCCRASPQDRTESSSSLQVRCTTICAWEACWDRRKTSGSSNDLVNLRMPKESNSVHSRFWRPDASLCWHTFACLSRPALRSIVNFHSGAPWYRSRSSCSSCRCFYQVSLDSRQGYFSPKACLSKWNRGKGRLRYSDPSLNRRALFLWATFPIAYANIKRISDISKFILKYYSFYYFSSLLPTVVGQGFHLTGNIASSATACSFRLLEPSHRTGVLPAGIEPAHLLVMSQVPLPTWLKKRDGIAFVQSSTLPNNLLIQYTNRGSNSGLQIENLTT